MSASHNNAEKLSAFIDGELSAAEVDDLLEALENPACRDQLARFSRCKSFQIHTFDISGAVAKCIEEESKQTASAAVVDLSAAKERRQTHLTKQPFKQVWMAASAFAVAASVAVVALNISPSVQQDVLPAGPALAQAQDGHQRSASILPSPTSHSQSLTVAPVQLVTDSNTATVASADEGRELVIPAPAQSAELDQLYLQHARYRGGYALAAPVSYGRVGVSMTAAPLNEAKAR